MLYKYLIFIYFIYSYILYIYNYIVYILYKCICHYKLASKCPWYTSAAGSDFDMDPFVHIVSKQRNVSGEKRNLLSDTEVTTG